MLFSRKKINAIPLSVVLALSGLPLAAQANTITLSATASDSQDGGAAVSYSDIRSTTGNPAPLSVPGFVNVGSFTSTSSGSNSGFSVYGDTGGTFISRAFGSGVYDTSGQFTQNRTVVNTSGSALRYFYTFSITNGAISASSLSLTTGQFANASYDVDILVNGSSLFQTNGQVLTDSNGQSLTTGGTNIFNFTSCPSITDCGASWGAQSYTLDLGILAPSATLELSYDLSTRAWGNAGGAPTVITYDPFTYIDEAGTTINDCSNGGYGGGYGGYGAVSEVSRGGGTFDPSTGQCIQTIFSPGGRSIARFGDPDSISGLPIGDFPISAVSVPEPGTLALLGAGLAGVVALRRRRKAKIAS